MATYLPKVVRVFPTKEEKKDFEVSLYKGEIPSHLKSYFSFRYDFPVFVPELKVFGRLCMKGFYGSSFTALGSCQTANSPVELLTETDKEVLTKYHINMQGSYVGPNVVSTEPDDVEEATQEELEEAASQMFPLTDLHLALSNLPQNRVLAQYSREVAISIANLKLNLLSDVCRKQQLYVSKWVSEDYYPEDFDESEQEELNIEPILYSSSSLQEGELLLDSELQEIRANAMRKEQRKSSINDRIRDVVIRTPQPMIKPPVSIPEGEEEAWSLLDSSAKGKVHDTLSLSPMHAHLLLSNLFPNNGKYRDFYLYSKALSTLGKMMFYCLKRLRFGELCQEKGQDEALKTEIVKDRWQPVSEEEKGQLLNIISRMILRTSNFHISLNKTVAFLDQFLPFWNIPGVNFTGSVCCFLTLHEHAYKKYAKFYTPTRFEIKQQDVLCDARWSGFNFEVYPLALFFPVEGSSEYRTQYMRLNLKDAKLAAQIAQKEILEPDGEIDCPWAYVATYVDCKLKFHLVRVLPNTDCDVPVFQHEELDNVALNVYSRVKRSGTVLERQERANGSHCWNISMSPRIPQEYASDPKMCTSYIKAYMNFYPVQIYRTREEHIWTHHVAMTRVYCKAVDGAPQFSASPDQINSIITGVSERYNYFAGKTTPLSILHKYKWRGFKAPQYIDSKFNLNAHYKEENLPIPVGLVTTKLSKWLNSK